MGNFSYKLYRLFLSLHSFSVTLLTLGSRLFFILLQIKTKRDLERASEKTGRASRNGIPYDNAD